MIVRDRSLQDGTQLMKIAQISPLVESVPPRLYGGTERVVSYLTEELVALGHEVTLFASGDSQTSARLIAPCRRALRLDGGCVDQISCHYVMLENVIERSHEFHILHFHVDYLHFPLCKEVCDTAPDDAAPPPQHSGTCTVASGLSRRRPGIHLHGPAQASALGELGRKCLPRFARSPHALAHWEKRLLGLHRAYFP